MEEAVKRTRKEIVDSTSEVETVVSPLTQCALDIAHVAITAFSGNLRDRALDIAKAIADYEDEVKR